ncbi:MAG: Ig-like domain-containing protein, partial [Candidatus Peregrinibacteria bacterium]|nr:Ig-like domain-containing protein [Candidatus Peregrinibacteria bacterium]
MRKFFGAALSFLLLIGVVEAQSPFVSVSDFLAGTSAPVRVSGLFAEESFFAELVRPNGTKISFEETADDLGVSNFEISTLHTKHAGTYELKVLRDVGENYTETIKVFPGVVSPYRSKIVVKNASIAADGEQVAQVEVQCMDAFGNVIAGERVKVFSSRNEDVVVAQKVSDSAGIVRAQIKSNTPGVSTVFAIAGDSLLFEKPEVVFYLSEESAGDLKNAGSGLGDFLKAQLFNEEATGEVAYFAIEGLADEVVASKNAT